MYFTAFKKLFPFCIFFSFGGWGGGGGGGDRYLIFTFPLGVLAEG